MKYALGLLAFLLIFSGPMKAEEGYIPFFPDGLEPDGIGFRGPASLKVQHCWAEKKCSGDLENAAGSMPVGTIFSPGATYVRSSPVTLEYRKEYFFKKLFYSQTFAEFGQTVTTGPLRFKEAERQYGEINLLSPGSASFLTEFLRPKEISKISQALDFDATGRWPSLNLLTESKFIFFGKGLGIDLWIFEASWGPFLMIHDTSLTLRSCKTTAYQVQEDGIDSIFFHPIGCDIFPDDVIDLYRQTYKGFAVGTKTELSLVFLETDNWRVSMDTTTTAFNFYTDSSFEQVSFRGLDFYPEYSASSTLNCSGGRYRYYTTPEPSGEWKDIDCINSEGEDHRKSSDYTYGLKVTYYFR